MTPLSRVRIARRRTPCVIAAVAAVLTLAGQVIRAQNEDSKDKKKDRAALVLKVNPPISFSPAHVLASAELRGASLDTDEFYCPTVEWDWGDGTKSESSSDCAPFEAGKSTVDHRWTASHTFETADSYRIELRLRRGSKTLVAGNIQVQVKPGARDPSEF
jgi:hypothetical protein